MDTTCQLKGIESSMIQYKAAYENYVDFLQKVPASISNESPKHLVQTKDRVLREALIYERYVVPDIILFLDDLDKVFTPFESNHASDVTTLIKELHLPVKELHDQLEVIFAIHKNVLKNVYNIKDHIIECEKELGNEIKDLRKKESQVEQDEENLLKQYLELEKLHEEHKISDEEYNKKEHKLEDQFQHDQEELEQLQQKEMKDEELLNFLLHNLEPMFSGHIDQIKGIQMKINEFNEKIIDIVTNTACNEQKQVKSDSLVKLIRAKHQDILQVAGQLKDFYSRAKKKIEMICFKEKITINPTILEKVYGIKK